MASFVLRWLIASEREFKCLLELVDFQAFIECLVRSNPIHVDYL